MTFDAWVYMVFGAVMLGLGADHFRVRNEVGATKLAVSELRTFIAENYVRSPEIERLSSEMSSLRSALDEAVKLLHEIKGSQNRG